MNKYTDRLDKLSTIKGQVEEGHKPTKVEIGFSEAVRKGDNSKPMVVALGGMYALAPREFDLTGLRVYYEGIADHNGAPSSMLEAEQARMDPSFENISAGKCEMVDDERMSKIKEKISVLINQAESRFHSAKTDYNR